MLVITINPQLKDWKIVNAGMVICGLIKIIVANGFDKQRLIMTKKKNFTIIAVHDIGKTTLAEEAIKCGLSVVRCSYFVGALNEPHAKCERCSKEEWQHKI